MLVISNIFVLYDNISGNFLEIFQKKEALDVDLFELFEEVFNLKINEDVYHINYRNYFKEVNTNFYLDLKKVYSFSFENISIDDFLLDLNVITFKYLNNKIIININLIFNYDLSYKDIIVFLEDIFNEEFFNKLENLKIKFSQNKEEVDTLYSIIELIKLNKNKLLHQIVFINQKNYLSKQNSIHKIKIDEIIYRIIYRKDIEAEKSFVSVQVPKELNRRNFTKFAFSKYVTFIQNEKFYILFSSIIINLLFLSISAYYEDIYKTYYNILKNLKNFYNRKISINKNKYIFEEEIIKLIKIENKIKIFISPLFHIDIFFKSIRLKEMFSHYLKVYELENYSNNIIVTVRNLRESLENVNTLFSKLESINSKYYEKSISLSLAIISIILTPIFILLSFFGMNTADIEKSSSFLDFYKYKYIYFFSFLVILLTLLFSISIYIKKRREEKILLNLMKILEKD